MMLRESGINRRQTMNDLLPKFRTNDRRKHLHQDPHPALLMHNPQSLQPLPRNTIERSVSTHKPAKARSILLPFVARPITIAALIFFVGRVVGSAVIAAAVTPSEEEDLVILAADQIVLAWESGQDVR